MHQAPILGAIQSILSPCWFVGLCWSRAEREGSGVSLECGPWAWLAALRLAWLGVRRNSLPKFLNDFLLFMDLSDEALEEEGGGGEARGSGVGAAAVVAASAVEPVSVLEVVRLEFGRLFCCCCTPWEEEGDSCCCCCCCWDSCSS